MNCVIICQNIYTKYLCKTARNEGDNKMNQLNPGIIKYSQLLSDIEAGRIKIPQFQRDFVWSKEASAKLLDSVIKRYPIGTFILWKTNETLRAIRNIGGLDFPPIAEGDFTQYVLDGQQRITSLYAGFKGCKIIIGDREKEIDYSEIYIDLEANEDGEIVVSEIDSLRPHAFIKITELLQGGLGLASKYEQKYHANIEEYKVRFAEYTYQTITISEAPIDIATEIFTRVNIGGKSLSVFEIMVAKTFDVKRDFDLAEKYDLLISRLSDIKYETISQSTVLQSVSICMVKECTTKHILKLNKQEFIDIWDKVMNAFAAAEYFKTFYRIPVSQLLPYDALLIPFTYYFYRHADKPLGKQQKALQDFFWRTTINSRYSSGQESKIAKDIKRVDSILTGENITYYEVVDISPEAISNNGYFSAGRAYIKGLLCLLAYYQPKSFIDNALVIVDNNYLKQANSKNYHHFFPRAYLYKKGEDDFWVNHIANITIVDDFLNKRKIRDRAPSKYIKEFEKQNPELSEALKSHLIGDVDSFGISNDDYDTFFDMRIKGFSCELEKRIILTDKDILKRNENEISVEN